MVAGLGLNYVRNLWVGGIASKDRMLLGSVGKSFKHRFPKPLHLR